MVFGTLASEELTEFFKSQYVVHGVYKNEDGSLGMKFTTKEGVLNINDIVLAYLSSACEINKRRAHIIYIHHGFTIHSA